MNKHFVAYAGVMIAVVLLATLYAVLNRPPVPHAATGQFTPHTSTPPREAVPPNATQSSQRNVDTTSATSEATPTR